MSNPNINLNSTNPFLSPPTAPCPPDLTFFGFHPQSLDFSHPQATSSPFPQSMPAPVFIPFTPMKKTFCGLASEDANRFMMDFEAHMVLMNIETNNPRYVAAFRLSLKGPALTWLDSFKEVPLNWSQLRSAFLQEYCMNTSGLIAEEASFNSLHLLPTQRLEEFHSDLQEKGRKLGKSDRELINRYTDGLPTQLAFFVRASRVTSYRECLHVSQTGGAHGYRQDVNSPPVFHVRQQSDGTCVKPTVYDVIHVVPFPLFLMIQQ